MSVLLLVAAIVHRTTVAATTTAPYAAPYRRCKFGRGSFIEAGTPTKLCPDKFLSCAHSPAKAAPPFTWQPSNLSCPLMSIEASVKDMLTRNTMSDLGFVGDSYSRLLFDSMHCELRFSTALDVGEIKVSNTHTECNREAYSFNETKESCLKRHSVIYFNVTLTAPTRARYMDNAYLTSPSRRTNNAVNNLKVHFKWAPFLCDDKIDTSCVSTGSNGQEKECRGLSLDFTRMKFEEFGKRMDLLIYSARLHWQASIYKRWNGSAWGPIPYKEWIVKAEQGLYDWHSRHNNTAGIILDPTISPAASGRHVRAVSTQSLVSQEDQALYLAIQANSTVHSHACLEFLPEHWLRLALLQNLHAHWPTSR